MSLSRIVALTSLLLAAALVAGHAVSEENTLPPAAPAPAVQAPATVPGDTAQKRLDEREARRRAAMAESQRRKEDFNRRCTKPVKTEFELQECRVVYRSM